MEGSTQMKWYSPEEAPFQLAGFAWWPRERKFRRLPAAAPGVIREAVDELANHTAGCQVRFVTDATRLVIKVKLTSASTTDHMPATGGNGFDCYLGLPGSQQYFATTRFAYDAAEYESVLIEAAPAELRGITLNFPLNQGLVDLQIGVNAQAAIQAYPVYEHDGKVVFYGTSITQGGCVSRPGMAYTNILSRRFNLEFINLGFSGNGKGDPIIAEYIGEIANPACIVLDYDANNVQAADLVRTMPEFIRIVRMRHPSTPILVISRIPYSYEFAQLSSYSDRIRRRDFQQQLVQELRANGDLQIYFCSGADLLGEAWNECTVDGVHPNDLGSMRIADGLTPILRELLYGK